MSAMRKFLQSLSGEVSPKQVPRERIDVLKALLQDLDATTKGEGTFEQENSSTVCLSRCPFIS